MQSANVECILWLSWATYFQQINQTVFNATLKLLTQVGIDRMG